jgi:hypothetical protein
LSNLHLIVSPVNRDPRLELIQAEVWLVITSVAAGRGRRCRASTGSLRELFAGRYPGAANLQEPTSSTTASSGTSSKANSSASSTAVEGSDEASRQHAEARHGLPAPVAQLPCGDGMKRVLLVGECPRRRGHGRKMLPLRAEGDHAASFNRDREKLFPPGLLRRLPDAARDKIVLFEFPSSNMKAPHE